MKNTPLEPCATDSLLPSVVSPQFDKYGHRILTMGEVTRFRKEGYLRVPTLTQPSEIAWIGNLIDQFYAHRGLAHGVIDQPTKLASALQSTCVYQSCLKVARQLLGRTAMYGNDRALYKEAYGNLGSPWHQDASFHGRYSLHDSIVFWIPLHDVQTENGCMQYIPLERNQVVLPHRPFFPKDPSSLMTDHAEEFKAVNCPLPAGGATIHGALTLHCAHVNTVASRRRVWTLTFRPWGRWNCIAPSRVFHVARLIAGKMMSSARRR